MNKYKLIGVTEYAERHLTVGDLESLKSMIGCVIERSEHNPDTLFIMPDDEETHKDFLEIEEII